MHITQNTYSTFMKPKPFREGSQPTDRLETHFINCYHSGVTEQNQVASISKSDSENQTFPQRLMKKSKIFLIVIDTER
jgi:hypothetical protein